MRISLPEGKVTELSMTPGNGAMNSTVLVDGTLRRKVIYNYFALSLNGISFEYDIPSYFEQYPFGETEIVLDEKHSLKPVLHIKLDGQIEYHHDTYSPSSPKTVWDPITDQLVPSDFRRRFVLDPETSGGLTFDDRTDTSTSRRSDRVQLNWHVRRYDLGAGKHLLIYRQFWLTKQLEVTTSGEIRWNTFSAAWYIDPSKEEVAGTQTIKDNEGKSHNLSWTLIPAFQASGGKTVSLGGMDRFYKEKEAQLTFWLTENLPVGRYSVQTRKQTWKTYPDMPSILDVVSRLQGLTALEAISGDEDRGYYSVNNLSYLALQTMPDFQGNGLMLAAEVPFLIPNILSFGTSLANTALGMERALVPKRIIDGKIRALARAWLEQHWGFTLTIKDLGEVLSSTVDPERKRVSAETSGATDFEDWVARYHIYYGGCNELQTAQDIYKFVDLELDASNLWDMVPYSFVVDWFYNLGSWLQAIDNYYNIAHTYSILGTVETFHKVKHLRGLPSLQGLPLLGHIQLSYFRRRVGDQVAHPTPPSDVTINLSTEHLVEAATLVVANTAR